MPAYLHKGNEKTLVVDNKLQTDLKEFVEDTGIVAHNISVLAKELSRAASQAEKDHKAEAFKQELTEVGDSESA